MLFARIIKSPRKTFITPSSAAGYHYRPTVLKSGTLYSMWRNMPESTALLLQSANFPTTLPVVDTHTHLASTYAAYKRKFPGGRFRSIHEFVRGAYRSGGASPRQGGAVEAIVDVWCEAPPDGLWQELADSALSEEGRTKDWGGLEYYFVMGVHPHNSIDYTDAVEETIIAAMAHPRCVGLGEIGLDYHYMHSPRAAQHTVLRRQLRLAVHLNKPLTIHTRKAEADTEAILKEEVPRDWKIHVHCFSDSPEFAQRLLDHFPNLYIGITGVITYSSNLNTSALIRTMCSAVSVNAATTTNSSPLRILLETDAPYMIPANIYPSFPGLKSRFPFSHPSMIPWTAQFVADCANASVVQGQNRWDADRVMKEARHNAKDMYGV